jgi:hypothetical protein
MFKVLSGLFSSPKTDDTLSRTYRDFIHQEAALGGKIFGAVPAGVRREFFCLDEHTWVWHEEWIDEHGEPQVVTTRYDIRPSGILKAQNGNYYQNVSVEESRRLFQAAHMYIARAKADIYHVA